MKAAGLAGSKECVVPEPIAQVLVSIIGVYVGVGLLVAVFLQVRGLGKLDRQVAGTGWGFRLLITPGLVALWPLFTVRLLQGASGPPEERNAHRDAQGDAAGGTR